MKQNEFKKHLLLYGADITKWPTELQAEALILVNNIASLKQLQAKEAVFEKIAMHRAEGQYNPFLANRIIAASNELRNKKAAHKASNFARHFVNMVVLPHSGYALAATIVIGILIGLNIKTSNADKPTYTEYLYQTRGAI